MKRILISALILSMLFGCGRYQAEQPSEYVDPGNTNTFPDSFYPGNERFEQKTLLEFKKTFISDDFYFYQNNLFFVIESEIDKSRELLCFDFDTNNITWRRKIVFPKRYSKHLKGSNNKLFVPAKEELMCLDSTGKTLWAYKYSNKDDAYLVSVFQNKVILHSDKKLICLEAVSGKTLWSCVPRFGSLQHDAITDEKNYICFMANVKKSLIGFDINNGEELFSLDKKEGINTIACVDDKIAVICKNSIFMFDTKTKKEIWTQKGYSTNDASRDFILKTDRLYYCFDKQMSSNTSRFVFGCRDISDGKIIWEREELIFNMIFCNGYIFEDSPDPDSIKVYDAANGELVSTNKFKPDTGLVIRLFIYKNKIYAIALDTTLPISKDRNKTAYLVEFER